MADLPVRMPALSATMEDAELLVWLVAVGDEVRSGQPLAEVATDKVDMELECPHDGVVAELLVEAGTRVDLGAVLATITSDEEDLLGDLDLGGDGGEARPSNGAAPTEEPPERLAEAPTEVVDPAMQPVTAAPAATEGESGPSGGERPARFPAAPPPVRKRAKRLGVDLAAVTPTGSRGQITHADLSRHLEQQGGEQLGGTAATANAPSPAATSPSSSGTRPAREMRPAPALSATPSAGDATTERRRTIRRATARVTVRSAAIPQFTLFRRIDLTVARERRGGRSWTTEIARALAAVLWRHPECNATWDEEREEAVPLAGVRIGVAVDTPNGLVVVGVDDPDADDPAASDARVKDAIARARAGKVTLEDTRSVSSTISNLGGLGVDRFDALLLPPQPTILSVGRMTDVPVVVDGHVRVRPQIEVGLTVDHRVADGADGARLLETFARRLES